MYKDTYADVIDKKEYWLDGDIDWAFIDWAKKTAGSKQAFQDMYSR